MEIEENKLSYTIRGAIFNVYNNLGPGLLESAYEEALRIELEKVGCNVRTQVTLPMVYEGVTFPNAYRVDMLVDESYLPRRGA
jgi:GxxExxY protein